MGMTNEIPISSQGPKGGNAQVLQDAERSAAYFGKYTDNPKRKWDELPRRVTGFFLVQKYPILQ